MVIESHGDRVFAGEYLVSELDTAMGDLLRVKNERDIDKITVEVKNV